MRVVIKFGTGVLAGEEGTSLDLAQFERFAGEIADQVAKGISCIIVSSGAIAAGVAELGLSERPADLPGKQACAAVGQPKLVEAYARGFELHGLRTAQLLLTHGDIDSRVRRTNAKTTLERLLATGRIVPVINENDSVATEELSVGDNDRLSAEVAFLAEADLLILLTRADGVLDQSQRVPSFACVDDARALVTGEKGRFSVGGMSAKLDAVKIAVEAGIETVIADGRKPGQISDVIEGRDAGTRFAPFARAKV